MHLTTRSTGGLKVITQLQDRSLQGFISELLMKKWLTVFVGALHQTERHFEVVDLPQCPHLTLMAAIFWDLWFHADRDRKTCGRQCCYQSWDTTRLSSGFIFSR